MVNLALSQLVTAGAAIYLDLNEEGEAFDASELEVPQNSNAKLN